MDLVVQARCNVCDKIFCCSQHRRSHELLSHPDKCKQMLQIPITRKQTTSYALEMRKLVYSENNRPNSQKSRKRSYLKISKFVVEKEDVELKVVSRKILVPQRKYAAVNKPNKEEIICETNNSDGKYEDNVDPAEMISPIEDRKGKLTNAIFTTSTPLPKRAHSGTLQFPAPLESIIEDIPRVQINTSQTAKSYRKRKVTFSESIESVYDTASEVTPESSVGIFTAVANVFQAALHRLPGVGDLGEVSYAVACSPGGSKRKRTTQGLLMGKRAITGRRPLHQKLKLLSPEN